MENGGVYLQTNDAARNELIAFHRSADGGLEPLGRFPTGGRGTGAPHLTSQGSVTLTRDRRFLVVVNAGSDELSLFGLASGEPTLIDRAPSGGSRPQSVAERDGLVYALNTSEPANVTGFRIAGMELARIEKSTRPLSTPAADPAQVGFSPDGATLVVTERGTDSIVTFAVGSDGLLGPARPRASAGPTPYGFAFADGETLIVTEAFGAQVGKAAASSYRVADGDVEALTRSLGNGRSEICWAVVTPDGRYVFTTNFADGAVSRYAVGSDGMISLGDAVAGAAIEGETGLRDEGLTADGRYLYAVDADGGQVYGWSVGDGGSLSPLGSWNGLPATVAGLAAT